MGVAEAWSRFEGSYAECFVLRDHVNTLDAIGEGAKDVIYESILSSLFRALENFFEDVFIDYLSGELALDGSAVPSYLNPRDRSHARNVLKPERAKYLDWNTPSIIRERCILFFEPDDPLLVALAAEGDRIDQMRVVRNHIAHNSEESRSAYDRLLLGLLVTRPTPSPTPGTVLRMIPSKGPARGTEVLEYFATHALIAAKAAVRAP